MPGYVLRYYQPKNILSSESGSGATTVFVDICTYIGAVWWHDRVSFDQTLDSPQGSKSAFLSNLEICDLAEQLCTSTYTQPFARGVISYLRRLYQRFQVVSKKSHHQQGTSSHTLFPSSSIKVNGEDIFFAFPLVLTRNQRSMRDLYSRHARWCRSPLRIMNQVLIIFAWSSRSQGRTSMRGQYCH